jgi:ABC-type sugar transport system ATPase subunit
MFTARPNMTLAALGRCCCAGWIRRNHERSVRDELIRSFSIRGAHESQPVQRLSGGNQQKVVLARTLFAEPDILLLDEPTRGIDVGAKAEVHEIIRDLARSGKAIVLASSELPELLSLSHRLLVMRQGTIVGELEASRTTSEQILAMAMP